MENPDRLIGPMTELESAVAAVDSLMLMGSLALVAKDIAELSDLQQSNLERNLQLGARWVEIAFQHPSYTERMIDLYQTLRQGEETIRSPILDLHAIMAHFRFMDMKLKEAPSEDSVRARTMLTLILNGRISFWLNRKNSGLTTTYISNEAEAMANEMGLLGWDEDAIWAFTPEQVTRAALTGALKFRIQTRPVETFSTEASSPLS